MSAIIDQIEKENMRFDVPDFRVGDTVSVHIRIIEGNKERVQVFKGVVTRRKNGTMNAGFTARQGSPHQGARHRLISLCRSRGLTARWCLPQAGPRSMKLSEPCC
jgi:ribosomal protein L19